MFINELFSTPTKWEYTKDTPNKVRAQFIIDTNEVYIYNVHIEREQGTGFKLYRPSESFKDMWDITFDISTGSYDNSDDITGTGNAITVFSTVVDIIESAVKLKNIQNLFFTADEPSRVKLYDRMSKHFAKKGWRYIDDREIEARADTGRPAHLFLLTKQKQPHEEK